MHKYLFSVIMFVLVITAGTNVTNARTFTFEEQGQLTALASVLSSLSQVLQQLKSTPSSGSSNVPVAPMPQSPSSDGNIFTPPASLSLLSLHLLSII